MKISEILNSSDEVIKSKLGDGPYLYYFDGEIMIDCSLNRIIEYSTQQGQIIDDIEIYAYGFKQEQDDEHQYINEDDLKKRFEKMEQEGSYEIISPIEDNGVTYNVPSYCDYNVLLYYYGKGYDLVANCKSIDTIIQDEMQKRIEKSDALRR